MKTRYQVERTYKSGKVCSGIFHETYKEAQMEAQEKQIDGHYIRIEIVTYNLTVSAIEIVKTK